MFSRKTTGSLMLLAAAFIWGMAFSAQKIGLEAMPPIAFNGIRMMIGCLVTYISYIIATLKNPGKRKDSNKAYLEAYKRDKKKEGNPIIKAGVICGLCLYLASNFQQMGLAYTTAGKAGFITALYIVMVPLFGIFYGKKIKPAMWGCVIIAVAGFYLMCITENLSLGKGDFLVFLCAVVYSLHIISVDAFVSYVDGVLLSSVQFLVCGVLSIVTALIAETSPFAITGIMGAMPALLYTGICSSGIAYTFQILGQERVPSALASLLMSFESVFSLVGGMIIFGEMLSFKEAVGCALVFAAVILAQKATEEKTVEKELNTEKG